MQVLHASYGPAIMQISLRPFPFARASRLSCHWLAAAMLGACLTLPAARAQGVDPLTQARTLLEQRQPAAAYELLAPLESTRAGDPAYDYLLGIAALDAGQITRAIFALERVLAVDPNNNLARAEIARAYLASGETDTARGELSAARRGPMPAAAAAAIDRVLSQLSVTSGDSATTLRGHLEAFAGWDSNMSSATSSTQFVVPGFGGLLFTLAPQNQARESLLVGAGGGLQARVPVAPDTAFIGNANGRFTLNAASSDYNPVQLDASAGLVRTQGADTFTGALQTSKTWIGGNGYRNASGLSAQWQRNLDATSQVAGFGQWSRLTYPNQETRDADRYVAGVGWIQARVEASQLLYGSVYLSREVPTHAGAAYAGHSGLGARIGSEWETGSLTWFAQAQAEWRRYGGTEPLFSVRRADDQLDLSVGVHWRPAPAWRITPQLTHTRNHSNVVIFAYQRTTLQVTARREF